MSVRCSSSEAHATSQRSAGAFVSTKSHISCQPFYLFLSALHPETSAEPAILSPQFIAPGRQQFVSSHCEFEGGMGHVQVLSEEILPALERLRREKGSYMAYQAAEATLDRLRRFVQGYTYVSALRCVMSIPSGDSAWACGVILPALPVKVKQHSPAWPSPVVNHVQCCRTDSAADSFIRNYTRRQQAGFDVDCTPPCRPTLQDIWEVRQAFREVSLSGKWA